jgi:hypothetical protein
MDIDTVLGTKRVATPAQLKTALEITFAVSEAIRACGKRGIPSGHLYANLMNRMNVGGFDAIIRTLQNAGLVEKRAYDLLVWIGPEIAS